MMGAHVECVGPTAKRGGARIHAAREALRRRLPRLDAGHAEQGIPQGAVDRIPPDYALTSAGEEA